MEEKTTRVLPSWVEPMRLTVISTSRFSSPEKRRVALRPRTSRSAASLGRLAAKYQVLEVISLPMEPLSSPAGLSMSS